MCVQHFESHDVKCYDVFPCSNGDPDIVVSIPVYYYYKTYTIDNGNSFSWHQMTCSKWYVYVYNYIIFIILEYIKTICR